MRTIYAIPNYECNLKCPHCELKDKYCDYDRDNFMSQLKSMTDDVVILFGGEPTLYEDRFDEIIRTKRVQSISTNLLDVSEHLLLMLAEQPMIMLSTSWNQTRFTSDEYLRWIDNLRQLARYRLEALVMITMTEDLIIDSSYDHFMTVLADIQATNAVHNILFEHYIGEYATEDYNSRCDDWLCRVHSDWDFTMTNVIDQKVLDWKFDCSSVYTLEPDGTLREGCPQNTGNCYVKQKCLMCEHSQHCQPCCLQSACNFPSKLFKLISEEHIQKGVTAK